MADAATLFAAETQVETTRATITRIIWSEKGRVIAKVQEDRLAARSAEGRRQHIDSVIGSMLEPMVGQLYEFCGRVEFDHRFKKFQMQFESYRTILPTDRDGIASYLIDVAKWIGPSIAQKLIDALGTDTLRVLREEPARVIRLAIPGLTPERVGEMSQSLRDNAELEAAAVEVNNMLGGVLGPATARKAIRKWRCDAARLIRQNPFELMALHGVGFANADAVHRKLGGDPRDLNRHAAALCHILTEAAQRDGHTLCSQMFVAAEGQRLIGGLRPDLLDYCLQQESVECEGACISLASLCKAEKYIAGKLATMLQPAASDDQVRRAFPPISTDGLAPDQVAAVQALQAAPAGILCGAPGTGKTYTVARIVRTLEAHGLRVSLAAPTGKAAKQMSLALGAAGASTIHSLLEPTVDEETGEFSFGRHADNQLECDVLIVDEFSMVDSLLCRSLLAAVPETTRLLIVGDHYQLPSVGPGAVLRDLLGAGVPHYELREIKRNAGRIVRACHAIKDGQAPEPSVRLDLDRGENWRHIDAGEPAEIRAVIESLITSKLPALGIDPLWGVQLVSPVNEAGPLSCDVLNDLAKRLINDRPCEEKLPYGVGDKVVRTKNGQVIGRFLPEEEAAAESGVRADRDPPEDKLRIANGDLGIVTAIDAREVHLRLRYPDRQVRVSRSAHLCKLAYCLTCHKMQGSEVDVVILPLHQSFTRLPMVTREWIYTAFSRAKKILITVGDLSALRPIVGRVGNTRRNTLLARLLAEQLRPAPCVTRAETDMAKPATAAAAPAGEWEDL